MNFPFIISKRPHLYIQVDSKYLKILESQITPRGPIVTNLLVESVYGLSEEETAKLLNDTVSSRGIRPEAVTAIISREKAMVRYMRLPTLDRSEIEKMVSFETAKQTPYSEDEIISDYEVLGSDEEGYSSVMLVISPKNEIARINRVLGALVSRLRQIRLSSEAIMGWLNTVKGLIKQGKIICLIDIDSNSTEIVIVSDGRPNFSRSISIGALDISKQKEKGNSPKEKLADEIKRSIAAHFKEKAMAAVDISEFVITGAGSVIEDFKEFFATRINTPCKVINVLRKSSFEGEAITEAGVPQDASICTVYGGPFAVEGINLISQKQKKKQSTTVTFKRVINISVALSILFLVLFGLVGLKIWQREALLSELKLMYSQVESAANQTEAKFKKLRSIKAQLSGEASSLNAIYNLYSIIPGNIYLSDFNYDDTSKVVRFRGRAQKISEVFKLVTLLESSESFSNVQTRSVAEKRTRGSAMVGFQISCNFVE